MNTGLPECPDAPGAAAAAATAAEAADAAERRRSSRERYLGTAWLSAEAGTRGSNQQVDVFNLSLHGVGFTSEIKFEEGAVHWIVIGAGGLRASSRVRVVSVRLREDEKFDYGGEFF